MLMYHYQILRDSPKSLLLARSSSRQEVILMVVSMSIHAQGRLVVVERDHEGENLALWD
jgi:hypothetical protein